MGIKHTTARIHEQFTSNGVVKDVKKMACATLLFCFVWIDWDNDNNVCNDRYTMHLLNMNHKLSSVIDIVV